MARGRRVSAENHRGGFSGYAKSAVNSEWRVMGGIIARCLSRAAPTLSMEVTLSNRSIRLWPISYSLGEGEIDNLRFASQIQWGLPDQGIQDHVLEKLSYLALTEVSDVRVSACYQLWIYTQDRIGRGLRQRAQASLDAAKCDCRPMPDALPCK